MINHTTRLHLSRLGSTSFYSTSVGLGEYQEPENTTGFRIVIRFRHTTSHISSNRHVCHARRFRLVQQNTSTDHDGLLVSLELD
ncbi:hypothetical protein ABKN59_003028 [Abortiporus biennis]